MPLHHDADTAIEFLRALHPRGPWICTAIMPDVPEDSPQKINNQVFTPERFGDFADWLGRFNPVGYNIYYGLNPLRPGVRRANKTDVVEVRYLHADFDPRVYQPDEDGDDPAAYYASEVARIQAKLDKPPEGTLRPTIAIASGGGANGLWRLAEPIILDGSIERAEEVERYNMALATALGGDHCHDISRILRMPGTINWPSETKRARHRVPALASVMWMTQDAHPLGSFRQVEPRQTNGKGSGRGRPVTRLPGNIAPIVDVSEIRRYAKMPEKITDRLLQTIARGADADPEYWTKGGKTTGNSEALFWVACELLRAGVPEAQVFAVITQPEFGISSHVIKHRSATRRVAERQIDRAKNAIAGGENGDVLCEMNDQFFVVGDFGGACVVLEEAIEPISKRPMLRKQLPDHFYRRFNYRKVVISDGEKRKNEGLGKWWFDHPQARRVDRVAFYPGHELPDNVYNLWQGFAVDPVPGDNHRMYLQHALDVLCDGDQRNYDYLIKWLAYVVQNPATPGEVAVVLRGGQGTGKGTFCRYFGQLWGRHYMQVTHAEHLTGKFNQHLADLVVLFADEAFFAGDKEHENVLKTIITEERMAIERKGVDIEDGWNFLHLIMASNKEWVVPTDADDRRYFILDLPRKEESAAYFTELRRTMDPVEQGGMGGMGNLLYYLQTLDLTGFNIRQRPNTTGLATQKLRTLTGEQEWWYHRLHEGSIAGRPYWSEPIPVDEVVNDCLTYLTKVGRGRTSATALGMALSDKLCPGIRKKRERVKITPRSDGHPADAAEKKEKAVNCYIFPRLADCRRAWDERMKMQTVWEGDEDVAPF